MDQPFAVDGYVLTDLIGFGATGEVWRGRDETTHEPVALKRLWEPAAEGLTLRLRQDAAVVAEVAGPHAVRILEVATLSGGEVVLVMDYAEGGSLASLLARRGRLHPSEVVTILAPLAQALAGLHRRGNVHGDITPNNVLFTTDGRPLLADFGLAIVTGEQPGDDTGYRDPSLDDLTQPTAASDCFGLAALGYAALTGVPPRAAGRSVIDPIVGRAPWVPAPLAAAIEAALAPDPAMRPEVAGFGAAVLASCGAAPVRLTGPRRTTDIDSPAVPAAAAQSRPRRGFAVAGMAAAVLGIAALVGVVSARLNPPHASALQPAPAAASADAGQGALTPAEWKEVVDKLDELRGEAYAAGQPTLLAQIYEKRASGRSVDDYVLAFMSHSHLRARGFIETVIRVKPQDELPDYADLRVVDRVSAYQVVDRAGHLVATHSARVRTYELTVAYHAHRWWVRSVTDPSSRSAS